MDDFSGGAYSACWRAAVAIGSQLCELVMVLSRDGLDPK